MTKVRTSGSTIGGMLNGVDRWSSDHLVGRTAERTQLEQALRDSTAGRVRVALVTGEAGVGKSRLVTRSPRTRSFRGTGDYRFVP